MNEIGWRMRIDFNEDVQLDSRRALFLKRNETLVLSDFFLGLGAARRKRPDLVPAGQHNDLWERLLGLLDDYQPKCVAILGDIKPNQGHLDAEEAEELHMLFRKLQGHNRQLIQVVGAPERCFGPSMESTGITPVETYRVGIYTLMHRRRIFVYPRHEPPQGFWINGGLHPLFTVPLPGPECQEEYLRYPSFLYTGFAMVMPPFVPYAQGWEVMQPERMPKQAKAWKVLGDHQITPLDLSGLPTPPESLRNLNRPQKINRKPGRPATE